MRACISSALRALCPPCFSICWLTPAGGLPSQPQSPLLPVELLCCFATLLSFHLFTSHSCLCLWTQGAPCFFGTLVFRMATQPGWLVVLGCSCSSSSRGWHHCSGLQLDLQKHTLGSWERSKLVLPVYSGGGRVLPVSPAPDPWNSALGAGWASQCPYHVPALPFLRGTAPVFPVSV